MSGDRELGLQYFHNVAENGKLFQDEAKYILGLAYNFGENNQTEANTFWTELHNKFPQNRFAETQKLRNDLNQLVNEKGADYLAAGIDSLQSKYRITNANVLNGLGYALMGNNDFDNALKIFQLNVKLYPHVANCYDSLAECYVNRDDTENAIRFYRKAYEMLPSDTTITEQFRQALKDGIEERLSDLGADVSA